MTTEDIEKAVYAIIGDVEESSALVRKESAAAREECAALSASLSALGESDMQLIEGLKRENDELRTENAKLTKMIKTNPPTVRFCDRTGHQCGTDTMMLGHECPCFSCQVHRAAMLARRELEKLSLPARLIGEPENCHSLPEASP
jgi:hypothetical protein